MAELKEKAKKAGLWNMFLPKKHYPDSLTNLEYASICEIMGRSPIGAEPFNCSAPDTGNMETLILYATPEQKKQWLEPLMEGEIRSGFAMTEPAVASSDATNIRSQIKRDGDHYVINGRKWWTSGAPDKRCKILIFMGQTDPGCAERHKRQSMILVPMDTPGVKVLRSLSVFGYDDAPHGHAEVSSRTCACRPRTSCSARAAASRSRRDGSGPGRIHHCMRTIGLAERALESLCQRAMSRTAFGKTIAEQGVTRQWIAESRMEIDQSRLLTLHAAHMMDTVGNKEARREIAMIKVVAPNMAQKLVDRAIQVHGGGGVSPGLPPRLCLCAHAHDAHRRRPGRSARGGRGQAGTAQVPGPVAEAEVAPPGGFQKNPYRSQGGGAIRTPCSIPAAILRPMRT